MKIAAATACLVGYVAAHGSMLTPRPRSSHSQVFDDANKCGSTQPYSNASSSGEYCGLGCLGDACLYYQIGCFQGCATCSLMGKTLYPLPADLKAAGCAVPPEPTLGGGNKTREHELRTYNIDTESKHGDWTKWMPWRSPGTAGKGNPHFQPCGVNGGALASQPEPPTTEHDVPNGGPGTALPQLPKPQWATWKAGSVVEAEWAIYANHGGGYSYRLCKTTPGQSPTEECYQKMPLSFATPETEVRYRDGTQTPFNITSPTTDVGTWPAGSQWRKNPVPMCGCDIGISCGGKDSADALLGGDGHGMLKEAPLLGGDGHGMSVVAPKVGGKTCIADPTCDASGSGCQQCANSTSMPWSCNKCCDSCTTEHFGAGSYCVCNNKPPSNNDFTTPYPTTHLRPGQQSKLCPTGVQFETLWDGGAGAGFKGDNTPGAGNGGKGFGRFEFTMVDRLQVPVVPPGEYSVSWRWDCEETPQVWNSCADIIITE